MLKIILVLIDFTKFSLISPFDYMNHEVLIEKLKKLFGFCDLASLLIKSYLTERTSVVFNGGRFSNYVLVNKGVPQGSNLGPLLFSLYIWKISLINHVNDDLKELSEWFYKNYLNIKAKVSMFAILSQKRY